MLQPATVLNDRYRVEEPVGEGGMSTVYRAVDTRLGRTVAIKVLHPQFARDAAFLQRFQQEAEFAASLGAHPNIVAIYDIGQDRNTHYIVQELVEGRSLKELIQERAPFSVQEAFAIGQQVASALDFAHRRGLVHRDVKPQNILITPEGVAKVTDFGIARSTAASQLTRTGVVIGTVHYFSPEQAQGKPAGPASDVYSLGIILYEMLTAHLPFDAENAIGIAMQHVHSDPPDPWQYNPRLPARAVATVMRALEKEPERRYRDAAEFASALGEQIPTDFGSTTIYSPLETEPAVERTAVYEPAEPVVVDNPPPRRSTIRSSRVVPAAVESPPNPWRNTLLLLGALLLVAAIAAASYFIAHNVLGGGHGGPTPTPTKTSTATPGPKKHHHRPTPAPTAPIFVPVATQTPLPTLVPTQPPPTWTPAPAPTPTPTPKPPTPTPIPPTLPPTLPPLPGPTDTSTAVG